MYNIKQDLNKNWLTLLVIAFVVFTPMYLSANPTPGNFQFKIKGNKSFSDDELRSIVKDEQKEYKKTGRPGYLSDIIYKLTLFYKDRGYPFVLINKYFDKSSNMIALSIIEGMQVKLKQIKIKDNRYIPTAELQNVLVGEFPQLFSEPFAERLIDEKIERLISYYHAHGFINAYISRKRLDFNKDKTEVTVVVWIDEGHKYKIKGFKLNGKLSYAVKSILYRIDNPINSDYFPNALFYYETKLREFYANRGRPFVLIESKESIDDEKNNVYFTFNITEGVITKIKNIEIKGNELTRSHIIKKKIQLDSGDIYKRKLILESQNQLLALGIFQSVIIDTVKIDKEGKFVNLVVSVKEDIAGEIKWKLGYGSYEKLRAGIDVNYKNVFGTGRKIRGGLKSSLVGYSAETEYIEPWFFNTNTQASLKFKYEKRQETSFDFQNKSITFAFLRKLRDTISISPGFKYEFISTDSVETGIPQIDKVDFTSFSTFVNFSLDTRDNFFNPSKGMFHSVGIEYGFDALGGELGYLNTSYKVRWYSNFKDLAIIALGANVGRITPTQGTSSIPIVKRYFAGGENSVRGFRENKLGPGLSGQPIGGEAFLVLNSEIRFTVWKNIKGAVFYDIGNVWSNAGNISLVDLRAGYGTGLRYITPLGPIRLDYGINSTPDPGEKESVFYLSVGFPF